MLREAWRAEILGTAALRGEQGVVTHVRDRTLMALVAMLCLQPDFSAPRPLLVESLWPEQDPDVTGNRLRVLLHRVRALFEPLGVERGTVLQSHRHVIALNPAGFSCDAADFLAGANVLRFTGEPAARRFGDLERAAQLYAGELLPGFYHDWVIAERTRLASLHFQILCRLTHDAAAMGQPERGLPYARQAASYEPLEETAQFGLIQTLGLMGQTFEALRQYEQYCSARFAETGTAPSARLQDLANLLRQQKILPSVAIAPDIPPARPASKPLRSKRDLTDSPKEVPRAVVAALPPRLTRFFGRNEEINALRFLLAPDAPTRLVTLLGPGGIGKTRLAIETAQHLLPDYNGRVFFAALADVTSAAQIPDALLHALRLSPSRKEDALSQALLALRTAPALLIIDNLEHLLPVAKSMIVQIVGETPSLHCLVTSRSRVGMEGEQVYALAALPLPLDDANGGDEPLAFPAVALFVDRARASRVDFALTKTNALAVQTLCRRLEGMPLALELAAARARVLSVPEMLEQIGTGLDWLSDVRGGKDTRHQTLRAAIDWSYRLLSPAMAHLFAVLSIFAGGFTIEAALAVWDDPTVSFADMLVLLETLCGDSLLFARQDAAAERTRFDMLQSLQAFGQEQLAARGETDAIRNRHLRWFTSWAEAAPPMQDEIAFQKARADEDNNFRAALEWGMRTNAPLAEQTRATRLARTLPEHFMMRGNVTEGRAFLRRVMELPVDTPLKTAACLGEARLAIHQGDYAHAAQLSSTTLALAQAAGDAPTVGGCFLVLGMAAFHAGDYSLAGSRLEKALQILTLLGDGGDYRKQIAECLLYLGLRHWYQADHAKAKRYLEQAKAVYQEMGSRRGVADCLLKLGNVFRDQGDIVTGEALLHEALVIFEALDHRHSVANTLHDLGLIARFSGFDSLAEARFTRALAAFREMGTQRGAAACLHNLAAIALGYRRWDEGRTLLVEAMEIYSRTGDKRGTASSLVTLSAAYEGAERLNEAAQSARQAIALDREIGNRQGVALGQIRLGSVLLARGDLDEAQTLLLSSLEQNMEIQSRPSIMQSLEAFAFLCHLREDWERAVGLASVVATEWESMDIRRNPHEAHSARQMLDDAKAQLGEGAFEVAWAAGAAWSFGEACAQAQAACQKKPFR